MLPEFTPSARLNSQVASQLVFKEARKMQKTTLGVIVGNRGFFPNHLCETGREEMLRVLTEEGIEAVIVSVEDTNFGSVETLQEAQKCAALFRAHADEIDGILVTLPNFGEERGIADSIRLS
jgi:L-fucose isomerase-like protein